MVNLYRRGRIAEKKVANSLLDNGFDVVRRSAGSRGCYDVYGNKGGRKFYIQVKSGSARISKGEISCLRKVARKRHGTAAVVHRKNGENKWRFL